MCILFLLGVSTFWMTRVAAQDSVVGVDLGGGIVTKTDVRSYAALSQDVALIKSYLSTGQVDEAKGLFRSGLSSERQPGVKRSLASLGDEMAVADPKTPGFLFHLYGVSQLSFQSSLDSTKLNFVNTYVVDMMDKAPDVAVDAVWAGTLYTYATHLLFTGVFVCQKHSIADDPTRVKVGTANWDEFIALYIGQGQTAGSTNGNSLYQMAQFYGNFFNTSDPEAPVNTKIKNLYQQAMSILALPSACTANTDTAKSLWKLAVQTTSEMSKPLFQGLLHAVQTKDKVRLRLYAHALIPQWAKCRPSLYKRMYDTLIVKGDTFDVADDVAVQSILDALPDATSCFGYSCGDLAVDTGIEPCHYDFESYLSYAGYVPTTPVRAVRVKRK